MSSTVSAVRVRDSVHEAVAEAMELARWRDYIPAGAEVALKPNLGWDLFFPGCVSSPWVVEAVILMLRDHVSKLYMVESDQVLVDMEKAFRTSRMDRVCKQYGIEWVNMSHRPYVELEVANGMAFETIQVPEILRRTTLVTIPCLKTHNKTTITGAIKNQWGCLPKLRHSFHLVLDGALADINAFCTPAFAVMDGTVGLEGNSPKSGKPRVADLVLASGDFVALDTIAARFMGFDPKDIAHVQNCHRLELGCADESQIELVGTEPRDLNLHFEPAEHNLVSWVEIVLRRSAIKKLIFDTPIIRLCCWGALVWYWMWFYGLGIGRRRRDAILYHTRYGEQWR